MHENVATLYQILRVLFGTISGLLALAFFFTTIRALRDPDFAVRRRITREIRRYHRGEISEKQLEAACPEGSIKFGFVIKTRQDGKKEIIPRASMCRNF